MMLGTRGGPTLDELAGQLESGTTTSQALVDECLARIEDTSGEGGRAFVAVDRDKAMAAARAADSLRKAKAAPSRYTGIPVSVKDLFDVAGEVTRAGSKALSGAPATADATAVSRWRRAGLVVIGRTNMTEFAFSGLGLNPHFGTPLNPWDRTIGRIPGGSSSGAAISVTDGMAHAGLGTDTGGSCRIPAAFTGLVGNKPTQARVPRDGAVPLSTSLDSVGSIARSVACCAALDAILAHEPCPDTRSREVRGLRLLVSRTFLLDGMDATVSRAFERTLRRLSDAGAVITERDVPPFSSIPDINAKGGLAAAESWAWHRQLIAEHQSLYDPRVVSRIKRGAQLSAADYIEVVHRRAALIAEVNEIMAFADGLLCATVPIIPPRIADLIHDDDAYTRMNLLALRNPTVINMIDGCAVSIPMHEAGEPPSGLMICGLRGQDANVFSIAGAVERALESAAA
jgi:aspartyl-tRNA(Asn)/glutamyl-tRNA(Gln) amidotransferase subunit A